MTTMIFKELSILNEAKMKEDDEKVNR